MDKHPSLSRICTTASCIFRSSVVSRPRFPLPSRSGPVDESHADGRNQADYDVAAARASPSKTAAPNLRIAIGESPRIEIAENRDIESGQYNVTVPIGPHQARSIVVDVADGNATMEAGQLNEHTRLNWLRIEPMGSAIGGRRPFGASRAASGESTAKYG